MPPPHAKHIKHDKHGEHGGQLARIRREYPNFTGEWLDLSTAISPWSYPIPTLAEARLRALPDEDLMAQACKMAAGYYGVAESNIITAGGAQAFINVIPLVAARHLGNSPVFYTLTPTYNEYAVCAERFGYAVRDVAEVQAGGVVIVAHPNNPDGCKLSAQQAREYSKAVGDGGLVIIDEAFCDIYPEDSLVGLLSECENLLILKSFGKFFGLAGLRLGFCLGSPHLLALFSEYLGSWHVSAPALLVAECAYADMAWVAEQKTRIIKGAAALSALLESLSDVEIIANCGLFISVTTSLSLFEACVRHGIYIRHYRDFPNLYRFGLPTSEPCLARLRTALTDF